jgi:M6 family metalloprotease-like protein
MIDKGRKLRAFCARILVLGLLAIFTLAFAGHSSAQASSNAAQPAVGEPAQHVQLEGELQILNEDLKVGARVSYSLKTADGKHVPLHFQKNPPTHLLTGDHVQADGQLSSGSLILYSGSNVRTKAPTPTPTPTSTPVPYTFGAQYTLIILVNFQDNAVQPYTISDAQTMFSGPVNDYFKEVSYGQTSIVPTVVGWYTIPDSVTTCNISQIATDAQNAAKAAGVSLSGYTRYVYAFPFNSSCAFAGASNVGGNPSQSWINTVPLDQHTIDHELGHAFGLWHSHLLDCGTSATIGSNCTINDYGDIIDTMGAAAPWSPHYNAFQKERLGWLNYGASPSIQTVQSSGTYTISPYELDGAGPNALKILKSIDPTTGAKTWYYLEARQALGSDAFLTNGTCEQCYTQNETTGVLFHTGTDNDGSSSDLLDMTPATQTFAWWFDPSLVVGQSFQDSAAGVTFMPAAVSSTGATVEITIGGSAPAPSAISLTTNQSTYLPGQTVAITVTALSGTSPAAGASVRVAVTPPGGKPTTLTGTTGSNGTALLNYKLSKSALSGTYQVQATPSTSTGTPAALTAPATATFTVQ